MCVLLPPHSKFHLINETTCSWVIAKKWFSIRRPSAMLNLRISDFFLVSVVCVKICDCILNFVQFGRFAAEIWRYSLMIFKMAAVHHVGLGFSKFDIFIIHVRAMPPNSKFRLNRTIWSRVIAKKIFSIWRPSAILNLGISEFLSRFRRLAQYLRLRTRFRQIRTIRGWDMVVMIFKMAAVRHFGFIVTSSYCTAILSLTLLTIDIVLNFDVDRFHTFWYISTIMFHNFCLKFPIFALIFTYFWKKYGKILNLNVVTPKGTCVRETTCFELQMFNIFVCDLYTRRKELFDCLSDWLCACKKKKKLKLPLFV